MKIDLPSFVHGGTSAKVSDVAQRPFVQVNSNLQNILAYQVYIFNNQVIFYLSVTMFVCLGFLSHSRIFHSYGDVTITVPVNGCKFTLGTHSH